MAGSSPHRPPSYHRASPSRSVLEEIIDDDRNSEARHKYLLEAAKREHDRIREDAERVYREQLQREEAQRLLAERRKEEERIKLEEQLAAERTRLNALRATKVAIPPPLPEPQQPAPPTPNGTTPAPKSANARAPTQTNGATSQPATKPPGVATPGLQVSKPSAQAPAAVPQKAAEPARPATSALGVGGLLSNVPQPNGDTSTAETSRSAAPPPAQPRPDRYSEIHKNLKNLRKFMAEQAKTNPILKERMGDMRRELRKSVGQLTVSSGVAGVNRVQQQTIVKLMREALSNQVQSQLMDPNEFLLTPRKNPVEGAAHNEPMLPSVFLYLINIFAKAAISQFINEAGARPETADPIGVCVAATLSEPDFLWRGGSMIDILLAKFRIVCPVLFGYRGSEKTEQGRQRLGWWKENGRWVTQQQHMDRMTGLGAGFAAISLRKFMAVKKENPYPPRHYWTAMARIVNTPSAEISDTQCVVLKSMVENYEQKFIEFYGTAALAALRMALVEFPARAPQKTAAVNSLDVLAQLLKRDAGLVLG
ncbi:uncharacterized protein THITE_2107695 [Thermothielavioides terrestris NRRL 8126]|uniref:mRNA export factor GLE1 n=1 Tax=Thermothielavioides terrestris (strain ATCC 38088 / NRRL 8126) TaxID=578455 RepID=G2QUQ6_THETT|nr:uncharacterized protein THITE_2107695 [Thermothielavioides terrestris NRRL 8126]AEO62901.1 hypothetical protein THITE_2107695 [Thermothielavioides terrestris NRRL 8126]